MTATRENWVKIHHDPFCLLQYVKKAGLEEFWRMNDASKRENPGTEIRCYIGVSERAKEGQFPAKSGKERQMVIEFNR